MERGKKVLAVFAPFAFLTLFHVQLNFLHVRLSKFTQVEFLPKTLYLPSEKKKNQQKDREEILFQQIKM